MLPSGTSGASSSEATSVDQGPTRNEPSSSGSGSWKQYLNLSSDNEGNASAAPSTDRTPRHQPTSDQTVDQSVQTQPPAAGPSEPRGDLSHAPEPSNSSTWSGSWIGRWLNQEVSSSAQNEGGHEATSQPTGVMGPAAPSLSFLRDKIFKVLRSCARGYRRPRSDVLQRIEEDLRLETASPEKRRKIAQVLEELYTKRDSFVNSDQRPDYELTVTVGDWEREQLRDGTNG